MDNEYLESPEQINNYKWKAIGTVALATIMCSMDFSIANIAFPKMTRVFNTDISVVMWVGLVYTLVSICLMMVIGKIGDMLGRKKLYITGILLFTLGMIACSIAQNIGQLIGFRIIQGAGAAVIISSGAAFIAEAFPPDELGKGMGLLSASISAGLIIGPVLGGILLNYLDWQSIFYSRIPIGIIAAIMAAILLKKDTTNGESIRFDIIGTLTSSAGLFCLIFGVNQISKLGISSFIVLTLIVTGFVLLFFFIFFENRVEDPILDLTLFKDKVFTCFSLGLFLFFMGIPSYVLIMPFYLIDGIRLTPVVAGLMFTITSVTSVVVSPISGWLSDRFGAVRFSALGAGITIVALFLVQSFDINSEIKNIAIVLFIFGFGSAMYQTPNSSTIMRVVPKNRIGATSALVATVRSVGLAIGMALAGSIYSARKAGYLTEFTKQGFSMDLASSQSISLSFHDVLYLQIFFVSVVFLLTLTPKVVFKEKIK